MADSLSIQLAPRIVRLTPTPFESIEEHVMQRNLVSILLASTLALGVSSVSNAGSEFSAERGKTLHTQTFTTGKPETPTCTTCHGKDPRAPGRTPAGKVVDPMALSATPSRYTDPAKVEKWFKRNCNEVLGRECSAQEKGDWLSFMRSQ
jgi:hypothetical protein